MPIETYPPKKLATVELLTQEIAFSNPKKIVQEINDYHEKNTKYDSEYYELLSPPPPGDEGTVDQLRKVLERHFQQASSMEYHALVRAPSAQDLIPRIGDAILLRSRVTRALDIVKDVIRLYEMSSQPERKKCFEYFLQRWIYKFTRHVLGTSDFNQGLIALFEEEQKKGKDSFKELMPIFKHLSTQHKAPNPSELGYDLANMRRLYVIFSNLIFAYLMNEISIPPNLQKIFIEFQKSNCFDYKDLEKDDISTIAERKGLLVNPDDVKTFFLSFKTIQSAMKKSVLLGILVEPERKLAIKIFCELSIKGVAEMYSFIGNKLIVTDMTESQGRDWFINVYDTITEVVKEEKVLENSSIPDHIRSIFGEPLNFPTPSFREGGNEASPETLSQVKSKSQTEASAVSTSSSAQDSQIKVKPGVIDIPNLIAAQNLEELKNLKSIVIVQDSNVLDLVMKNWEIRGSLTFPELIELMRIPFQVLQTKAPGMREGRKFVSFAYLIALGLDGEHIDKFLDKLTETKQITPTRSKQLHQLYPIAVEQIGELQALNKDVRTILSSQGYIIPNVFHEKCETLRKIFMENYSYIQSLLSYWIIVEEIYYSIAKSISTLGHIPIPTVEQIEKFVASENEEYMAAYERALTFAGPLKTYFKKKYDSELQRHFVNVKIKNDLFQLVNIKPVNLAER